MANTALWILESSLAKKMGLARGVIVAFRKKNLAEKTDWRIERKQVELSELAIEKISTALGTTLPVPMGNNGAQDVPQLVELQVTRFLPNPRLLLARFPHDPSHRLVYVKVAKSKNFRPGMRIKTRPPEPGAPQFYQLEGRCPRYPGRW